MRLPNSPKSLRISSKTSSTEGLPHHRDSCFARCSSSTWNAALGCYAVTNWFGRVKRTEQLKELVWTLPPHRGSAGTPPLLPSRLTSDLVSQGCHTNASIQITFSSSFFCSYRASLEDI